LRISQFLKNPFVRKFVRKLSKQLLGNVVFSRWI